ncbi:hypothetical protein BDA96_06G175400 [Sorghum bicolor]|uniref:Uncharacterized protein n=2 Tax=Sorghum bicolor TaxID=4558 RepID=A0A921QTJ8_SORBI|nr:hypothetical protein BDA96_06G175400 [Sorghum bicolor]OQU82018.1 hypothetical protein SORBI_3006G159350 [Sorghum bicolor]
MFFSAHKQAGRLFKKSLHPHPHGAPPARWTHRGDNVARQRRVSVIHQSSRHSHPLLSLSKNMHIFAKDPWRYAANVAATNPRSHLEIIRLLPHASKSLSGTGRLSPTFVGFLGLINLIWSQRRRIIFKLRASHHHLAPTCPGFFWSFSSRSLTLLTF